MDVVPKNKVAQTVEILRELIRQGEWREFLPGERALCRRMQISRSCLRRALAQLSDEGMVEAAAHGRRRKVVAQTHVPKQTPPSRINYLAPFALNKMPNSTLSHVAQLRYHLGEMGFRLDLQTSQAFHLENPDRVLAKLVGGTESAAWILHRTTRPIQEWFQANNVPCVIDGTPQEGIDLSSLDIDFRAAARHAGGLLLARGHGNFALILTRSMLAGNVNTERGLREALDAHTEKGDHAVHVIRQDLNVEALCRSIDSLLKRDRPPTAYVVLNTHHAMTCLTHLQRRGVQIPQDASLVSLSDDFTLPYLVPAITRYTVNLADIGLRLSELVRSVARDGLKEPRQLQQMPELVQGRTLGRAESCSKG